MGLGEYPLIDELKIQIKPFEELWNLQNEFDRKMKIWKQNPLNTLVPDDVEAEFKKMFGTSNKLASRFEQNKMPKPQNIANSMKKQLTEFRPNIPIIRALCNPGLRDRHKQVINTLIGGDFKPDDKLDNLIVFAIHEKKDELEVISERASKEFSNENTMNKMRADWDALEFTCNEAVGKDSYILSGEAVEAIQTCLDDHIIKT